MNPLIFIGLFLAVSVSGEYCTYHPTFSTSITEYCYWGCCYSYIYPCCDTPYYADTPFIAGMTVGAVCLLVGIIGACVRSRRRVQTTVQYTAPGNQQVFSTTMASQVNSGVANTGYVNPSAVNTGYGNTSAVNTGYGNTSAVNTGYMGPPAYSTNYSTAFSNSGYTHTA
ncbi:uncharacterized protein LOC131946581 [Physella acuta]|uniref:uncharacterized protein LOC131946581 n=1 Tax=Physella acuta TaxID=109671 RepID=UPI0027DD42DE|nr:uncharacterized protein LOC131946581 [Physella acuta]